jgi:hypothetical protein
MTARTSGRAEIAATMRLESLNVASRSAPGPSFVRRSLNNTKETNGIRFVARSRARRHDGFSRTSIALTSFVTFVSSCSNSWVAGEHRAKADNILAPWNDASNSIFCRRQSRQRRGDEKTSGRLEGTPLRLTGSPRSRSPRKLRCV